MLKTLSIRNYTLIDEIEISFSPEFNIFIGETGAGKSVIVGALMLALGSRATTEHIRKGQDKAVIEAIFELPAQHKALQMVSELGVEDMTNEIITRREIYSRGNSRCFVNDTPVPLAQLKRLGQLLADFHGQHDGQLILKPENHINFIDLFTNEDELLAQIKNEYTNQTNLLDEYISILNQEKELKLQSDAYKYELNEINKIAPQHNEDIQLENELKILENSEILFEQVNDMLQSLYTSGNSVYNGIADAEKNISKLADIDDEFSSWFGELQSAAVSIKEISEFAQNYREHIDFNQERIEEIRLRLSSLAGLKKKYGSYAEIFSRMEFLESKLALVNNFDNEISRIENKIKLSKDRLGTFASRLSRIRKSKSKEFERLIVKKLNELSLDNVVFKVDFNSSIAETSIAFQTVTAMIDSENYICSKNGIDSIEFYISTNKGEQIKPLANVASGGELSRIMLAIKALIANRYLIPTLIFDEIDTGISGRVAQMVGLAIKELAASHQIIAITHLAQIAAMGDKIITVNKYETKTKTTVTVREESNETKNIEIAKLISGENISQSSLDAVKELLDYQRKD